MVPKVTAIIPAAGRGERISGELPKQFRHLGGHPLVAWSLSRLAGVPEVKEIIVGVPEDWMEPARELLSRYALGKEIKVIAGGPTRQETVRRCLAEVSAGQEVVVIHDAARPFVSPELIEKVLAAAWGYEAATAAIPLADTIKMETSSGARENLPRERLWQIQTPQTFRRLLIQQAHEEAAEAGFVSTDDTALVERMGKEVVLVPGSVLNLKITTEEDWLIAAALVESRRVKPL